VEIVFFRLAEHFISLILAVRQEIGLDEIAIERRRRCHTEMRDTFDNMVSSFETSLVQIDEGCRENLASYRGAIFDMCRNVGESRLSSIQHLSELTSANGSIYSMAGRFWSGSAESVSFSTQREKMALVARCRTELRGINLPQLRAVALLLAYDGEDSMSEIGLKDSRDKLILWALREDKLEFLVELLVNVKSDW
jgi:hypothetical protein